MSSSIPTLAYRHPKKEGMFLLLAQTTPWEKVPPMLQEAFGQKSIAVEFDMHADKKLARVDGAIVWQALTSQGYYVQMPPADPNALQQVEDRWIASQESSHND